MMGTEIFCDKSQQSLGLPQKIYTSKLYIDLRWINV